MDFVLTLHSHIPYVLNHGRWPHGSDWLCEAALDSYLPLLLQLERLAAARIPAPVTLGITPILANQLQSPVFRAELEHYLAARLRATADAEEGLLRSGDGLLIPIARRYGERLVELRERFRATPDLTSAFGRLVSDGRLELMSSAATHGFLPLLGRDESIRLQLLTGRAEHRRIFGHEPGGLWLPECAYRPAGPWAPLPGKSPEWRAGLEDFIAEAGYDYCFVDSHLADAGTAVGGYADEGARQGTAHNSPYTTYRLPARSGTLRVFVRDPVTTRQVWSRHLGYPGDEWYREFHKIRWPEGLKLWRVSAPGSDLGDKHPYQPDRALERVRAHAGHFASLVAGIAAGTQTDQVLAVPFDTELFGHWWFEGAEFVGEVYRAIGAAHVVRPTTASEHLQRDPASPGIALQAGSWGAEGDDRMWLNPGTGWTWARLWRLEEKFWQVAPDALRSADRGPVLAQAARELLLAMSSDWQFIMSTGEVADYGVRRFTGHCDDAESLLDGLAPGRGGRAATERLADELWQRDRVFPDVLDTVREVVGAQAGRRSPGRKG